MNTHADKSQQDNNKAIANNLAVQQSSTGLAINAPVKQAQTAAIAANTSVAAQLQEDIKEEPVQGRFVPVQKKENNTGLPDNLKSGVEALSGFSMNDVKVHYNSSQPAQLNALAYAQGTDIHVAPGQEQHLPHEAWHVAQQKQGRVKATMQMKEGVPVNDDAGLEQEADTMGAKAVQLFSADRSTGNGLSQITAWSPAQSVVQHKVIQLKSPLVSTKLNVVGEEHPESDPRRQKEQAYSLKYSGSANYWTEAEFKSRAYAIGDFLDDQRPRADPFKDRFEHVLIKAESTNPWHYQGQAAPQGHINFVRDHPDVLNVRITEGPHRFANDMRIMIGNLEAGTDGFDLSQQEKVTHIGLKAEVTALYQQAATCLNRLTTLPIQIDATVAALDTMWANLKALIVKFGNLRTDSQVRISRSDGMHTAAETRNAEKGVWKIGEAHRNDMKNKGGSYNLVSRQQFNDGLFEEEQLVRRQQAHAQGSLNANDEGNNGIGNDDL
jgi:hypothetical protein